MNFNLHAYVTSTQNAQHRHLLSLGMALPTAHGTAKNVAAIHHRQRKVPLLFK